MSGVRRGARSVLKYFAPLYVVLIVIQVFLAGEGIFRMKDVKDSDACNKAAAHCVSNSKSLDAHRFLGFLLTEPIALLFLIAALLAWYPSTRLRTITILAPILTFVQVVLAGIGGWVAGLHPVNAFIVLGMFGWLSHRLREAEPAAAAASAPLAVPAD
jgi:hypothetical protein